MLPMIWLAWNQLAVGTKGTDTVQPLYQLIAFLPISVLYMLKSIEGGGCLSHIYNLVSIRICRIRHQILLVNN